MTHNSGKHEDDGLFARTETVQGPFEAYAVHSIDYDGRATGLIGVFGTQVRAERVVKKHVYARFERIKAIRVGGVTYPLGSPVSVPWDEEIGELKAKLVATALSKLTPAEIAALGVKQLCTLLSMC